MKPTEEKLNAAVKLLVQEQPNDSELGKLVRKLIQDQPAPVAQRIFEYDVVSTTDLLILKQETNMRLQMGFVPFGEIVISYSPTYVMPGSNTTLGGYAKYTREFVKYQPSVPVEERPHITDYTALSGETTDKKEKE